jgi:hypothetical protein
MNRAYRRAAKAQGIHHDLMPDNLARLVVAAEQAGQPGYAELLREVRHGGLALIGGFDRHAAMTVADLNRAARPTVVLVGDDDYQSTGPRGWSSATTIADWAECAVVHAAASTAVSYAAAAAAARLRGRAVLIETSTAFAYEWEALFSRKHVLLVLPKNGRPHPVMPAREAMH